MKQIRHRAGLVLMGMLMGALLAACTHITPANTSKDAPQDSHAAAPLQAPPTASIVRTGIIECFPAGYAAPSGKPATCEVSAAQKVGAEVLLISDKETPDATATQAFWLNTDSFGSERIARSALRYDRRPALMAARKIEELTASPDGAWVFATTAFSWPPSPESHEPDPYNTLLYWPAANPADLRVAHPRNNGGVVSSVSLRQRFAQALRSPAFPGGAPYFKIEGLAVLPGGRLIFGVREAGLDYENFEYTAALIEVGYTLQDGVLRLDDKFADAVRLRVAVPGRAGLHLGLSALMFDAPRNRLLMLTSAEGSKDESENSAYLWSLPLQGTGQGAGQGSTLAGQRLTPQLVTTSSGEPLRLGYKAEGMTLLADDTLLVVYDEDRVPSTVPLAGGTHTRAMNESIFSVLRLH